VSGVTGVADVGVGVGAEPSTRTELQHTADKLRVEGRDHSQLRGGKQKTKGLKGRCRRVRPRVAMLFGGGIKVKTSRTRVLMMRASMRVKCEGNEGEKRSVSLGIDSIRVIIPMSFQPR
jgi:hypothetical protein